MEFDPAQVARLHFVPTDVAELRLYKSLERHFGPLRHEQTRVSNKWWWIGDRGYYSLLARHPLVPKVQTVEAPRLVERVVVRAWERGYEVVRDIDDGTEKTERVESMAQWLEANYPSELVAGGLKNGEVASAVPSAIEAGKEIVKKMRGDAKWRLKAFLGDHAAQREFHNAFADEVARLARAAADEAIAEVDADEQAGAGGRVGGTGKRIFGE